MSFNATPFMLIFFFQVKYSSRITRRNSLTLPMETGGYSSLEILEPLFHLAIFSREQAKSQCDWVVMSSVFVASQSNCFFLCSHEQIRLVENSFASVHQTTNDSRTQILRYKAIKSKRISYFQTVMYNDSFDIRKKI